MFDKFMYFALGTHKRVGEASPVRMLVADVMGLIFESLRYAAQT